MAKVYFSSLFLPPFTFFFFFFLKENYPVFDFLFAEGLETSNEILTLPPPLPWGICLAYKRAAVQKHSKKDLDTARENSCVSGTDVNSWP